jgi:integrase
LAVRYGAIRTNPTSDIGRITARTRRQPRALTRDEREQWIRQLHADPVARRKDLPDLCAFMLATGVRIGEALAVAWDDVDLDGRSVVIEHTIIRVKSQGLARKTTKSLAGERTLRLPDFAMGMLRRR